MATLITNKISFAGIKVAEPIQSLVDMNKSLDRRMALKSIANRIANAIAFDDADNTLVCVRENSFDYIH